MKQIPRFHRIGNAAVLLLLALLPAAGLHAQDQEPIQSTNLIYRQDVVVFGHDFVLETNQVSRDIVVIGGNATIKGTARGDVVVVFGSANVTGKVERDLVVILGSAQLGERARLERHATVIGGDISQASSAEIAGSRQQIILGEHLPAFEWIGDWFMQGLLLARPLPPQNGWVWAVAGVFALTYILLLALFPQPVTVCVRALEQTPGAAFLAGVLGAALIGPLVVLLVISVAGILVVPVLLLALAAAALFGKLAVYRATGERLARQISAGVAETPLITLLIGIALFYVLYMVPVLGLIAWGATLVWGIGAVLMAAFASIRMAPPRPAVVSARALRSAPVAPGAGAATTPPVSAETPVAAGPVPESAHETAQAAGPRVQETASSAGVHAKTTSPPLSPRGELLPSEIITLERAGFWVRLCATVLDFILLALLLRATGGYFLLIWVAYHVAMWSWKGTTIGGIIMGIKIVRNTGEPIGFAVAFVRSLSSFFSALPLFIGFFWAGWDRNKEAWHDKIAGTNVVKMPRGISIV